MRICLINPPWLTKKRNIWTDIRSTMPPLGILYLASILEREKIDVDVVDYQAKLMDWNERENMLRTLDYDVFGITATTSIVNNGYRVAELIRRYHFDAKIIFGGIHVTALPEEALNKIYVDFVIRGEGETALLKLLKGEPLNEIEGLSYKNGGEICHIMPDGFVKDLDSLPFPAYHKVDLKQYKPAVGAYKRLPAINMATTRGCPGKCTFCNSANITLRKRSAENVYQEMKMLSEKYGIKEISFYDDTFTVFPSNIKKLCKLLIENSIDLSWCCFARTDSVTTDLLKHMKAAGCHQVMYGIESANIEILKNIKKNIHLDKNRLAIKAANEAAITVRCTFMFGSPGETEETIDETMKYAKELNPDIALFNITTPYPGTEMFNWAKENGYLLTENWDDYDLSFPVMRLPTIPLEVLTQKYGEAFKSFYLRPRYILRKFLSFKSFMDIYLFMEGIKSVFRFIKFR